MGPTNKEISIIMKIRDEVTKHINTIQGRMIQFGNAVRKNFLAISASIAAATVFIKQMVEAANQEEDAIKRLNNALQLQGKFTDGVSRNYQKLATDIQKTTRFSEEAVMEMMQQFITIGNVGPENMERITRATLDFATATGRDLSSAADIVAKAMAGNTGALSRYGIMIDKNIPKTQKQTEVLRAMERQFSGFAEKDVDTFSGKTAQLSNAWGDVIEELGKFITTSPRVGSAIVNITELLGGWAEKLNMINKRMKEGSEENLIARIQKASEFIEQQQKLLGTNLFGNRERQEEVINQALQVRAGLFIQLNELRSRENGLAEEGNLIAERNQELLGKIIDLQAERQEAIEEFSEITARMGDEDQARFEEDLDGRSALLEEWHDIQRTANETTFQLAADLIGNFRSGMGEALSGIILGTKKASEAWKEMGQAMLKTIVDWVVQKGIAMAMEFAMAKVMQKFVSTTATMLANAWAPAAALASLATLGGNAAPASAGMAATAAAAYAIANVKPMARGGDEIVRKPTLFLAGEAGPERASFEPLGGPFKGNGGRGDIHIHIGPVYQLPGESTQELAVRLGDESRRQLAYRGL